MPRHHLSSKTQMPRLPTSSEAQACHIIKCSEAPASTIIKSSEAINHHSLFYYRKFIQLLPISSSFNVRSFSLQASFILVLGVFPQGQFQLSYLLLHYSKNISYHLQGSDNETVTLTRVSSIFFPIP